MTQVEERVRRIDRTFTAVDLFSGSGAATAGLKHGGFSVLAAVDNDPTACKTFRLNHPEAPLLERDIAMVDPAQFRHEIGSHRSVDLLVICAPCQPFSNQNRKRAANDPRARLILETVGFVKVLRPLVVFIENVPGIADSQPFTEFGTALAELGYRLSLPQKLDAANLGVPQRRHRCIMIAARNVDTVQHFGTHITAVPQKTVRDAIGALRSLSAGEADPVDPLHQARRHHAITITRLRHIPKDGGSRISLPPHLQLACHKDRDGDFPDVYGRMSWGEVAPTLTTGCTDLTRGRFAHPRDDRAISLREAALLQSFNPTYKFAGNSGQIAKQIGNAVPMDMVSALCPYLCAAIIRERQHNGL